MNFSQNLIYSLVDLTSLNEHDDRNTMKLLCDKALEKNHAAICIFPQFLSEAVSILKNTPVKIATVVNFPYGMDSLSLVLAAIDHSLEQGADEIDMVFPYQKYMTADRNYAKNFVKECKNRCGHKILKVILETGVLQDYEIIANAACDMIDVGADFLKTSTGKTAVGATPNAVEIILRAIHTENPKVGIKISGGIRTPEQMAHYLKLAELQMGTDWVTARHFRFGVSMSSFKL